MSDYTITRVTDTDVRYVLAALTQDVENFYRDTYGTADSSGHVRPEMFLSDRGGLISLWEDRTRLVGMAGWTDLDQLGYGTPDRPRPVLDPNSNETVRVAELRRLFLVDDVRGKGLSTKLDTARLEHLRDDRHFDWAVGETGHAQDRSRAIHSRPPYRTIPPFGDFAHEAELGSHYYAVRLEDI